MKRKERITVQLRPEIAQKLKRLVKHDEKSQTEIIHGALRRFILYRKSQAIRKKLTRKPRALVALKLIQNESVRRGLAPMTMAEINAEIQEVRKARKEN